MAALLSVVAIAPPLAAQQPLRITPPAASEPDKSAREQELEKVRSEQRKAAEAEAKLKAEIEAIGQDRRNLSRSLIDTAARLREMEARNTASEQRYATLKENEEKLRQTLEGRRSTMGELLAALQRIGRKPPPALVARPRDALDAVRSAMLLGTLLPELKTEAETLAADLAGLVRVGREISEASERLDREMAALAGERQRMALLIEERQKRQTEAEKALEAERHRSAALAHQANNLKELIAKIEQEAASRQTASASAESAAKIATPHAVPGLRPAIPFASASGMLPLPVNGVRIREFGGADGTGGIQKGLSVATRAGAQVTAPSDGWVVYAGPFRSYGQLLILNAGGGYHILLAGMERISVDPGQFVLTGEPVAVMGGGSRTVAATAIGTSQPILYIEFRKDGVPVDPGPWWAVTDSEKVRG